jgi:putative protein kinase ArgK-like GTPase of G3E family
MLAGQRQVLVARAISAVEQGRIRRARPFLNALAPHLGRVRMCWA